MLRIFGGERVAGMMTTLKTPEDMPLDVKMLSNVVESSQKKIEGRNFAIRKSVLQYDDVMNRQRELIYSQRDQVLNEENISEIILKMIDGCVNEAVDGFCSDHVSKNDWNIDGLREKFKGWLTVEGDFRDGFDKESARELLLERAHDSYHKREELFGTDGDGVPIMRELEKRVLLGNVDRNWMDHIDAMDQLRKGIGLRAYAQTDPVVAYRQVGSEMFDCMTEDIRENTARQILTIVIKSEEDTKREQAAQITGTSGASDGSEKGRTVKKKEKVGRNDPCPCGSGKKYKNCCGKV